MKKLEWVFNIEAIMNKICRLMLILIVVLFLAEKGSISAQNNQKSVSNSLQDMLKENERLKKEIANFTVKEAYIRRMQHLLDSYGKCVKLLDKAGKAGKSYEMILEAYPLELILQSLGHKETVVSSQLISLKSRILLSDGVSLMSVLRNDKIPSKERYYLVDMLESVVENGMYSKFAKPTNLSPSLSKEISVKLKAISKKIEKGMAVLPGRTEDGYEDAVGRVLEIYLKKAEILADAGFTIDAFLSYSEAFEMEVQLLGPAMGERSITPLAVGNFSINILEREKDFNKLLEILHSKRIPLKEKKNFLCNLKDMIRLNNWQARLNGHRI